LCGQLIMRPHLVLGAQRISPIHTHQAHLSNPTQFDHASAAPSPLPPPMATTTTTATVTARAANANFVATPAAPHPRPVVPPAPRAPSTLGPVKSEAPPAPSSTTSAAAPAAAASGPEDPSYIITIPSYSGKPGPCLGTAAPTSWNLKLGTLTGDPPRSVVLVRLHPRH